MKRIHFLSGLIITLFIFMHLSNHVFSIFGAEKHIEIMNLLRSFYRNVLIETILLGSFLVQIISGLNLFKAKKETAVLIFEKLLIWSGLYLAIFFAIHVSAVLVGRVFLKLDTNFYFGVAGLNSFPYFLFFIPYYSLAIISFFGHVAGIHYKKMNNHILGLSVINQSKTILVFGVCLTIVIMYGLTNHFKGVNIPKAYQVLIGK